LILSNVRLRVVKSCKEKIIKVNHNNKIIIIIITSFNLNQLKLNEMSVFVVNNSEFQEKKNPSAQN